MALLDEIELLPDTSLRRGEIALRGWRIRPGALRSIAATRRGLVACDLIPHIEQKGVDLRIGLDIARLALRQHVETIVVVTGDSDLVPAFKFARREGLRVFLDHLGAPVRRELKAHVDRVL
ncbi:MAG: NYN domain-containing protein [Planctomycetes bacterium]|nr:NYN domain-containing protein [Planctomycetota bacterium]